MAPVWAHAIDQFRRFPGFTGNNNPVANNDWNSSFPFDVNSSTATLPAQKQFIGVIEKPTRIFVPCRDAGEVYVLIS